MRNDIRLTKAQERALEWLPADGAWRTKAGNLAAAIASLSFKPGKYVEAKYDKFGPRGGWQQGYRLTDAGVALKAARATESGTEGKDGE